MASLADEFRAACAANGEVPGEDDVAAVITAQQDSEVLTLRGNGSLHYGLPRVSVGDAEVRAICAMLEASRQATAVRILDLRFNRISDTGCTHLAALIKNTRTLRQLRLDNNDFGDEGARLLAEALQINESVKMLSVRGCKIGQAGNIHLASVLQVNTSLEELDVGSTDLDITSLIAYTTVLAQNSTLRRLNLDRPLFRSQQEEGAVHIGDMLKANSGLFALSLEKHDITDFGLGRIVEGLERNSTLIDLNLACNHITRDGARTLATKCLATTSLQSLNLNKNRIEDEGAVILAKALAAGTSLRFLGVAHNNIGGQGMTALGGALGNLTGFHVWGNPGISGTQHIDPAATKAVAQQLQRDNLRVDVTAYEVDGSFQLAQVDVQ